MWDEFSMLGEFEINGLENFIAQCSNLKIIKAQCIK